MERADAAPALTSLWWPKGSCGHVLVLWTALINDTLERSDQQTLSVFLQSEIPIHPMSRICWMNKHLAPRHRDVTVEGVGPRKQLLN